MFIKSYQRLIFFFNRSADPRILSMIIQLAIDDHLTTALLDVFHQYAPRDPKELYIFFEERKIIINKLARKALISKDQIDLLLPPNQIIDLSKFEITLTCLLIIKFTDMLPPTRGWKNFPPDQNDLSISAYVLRARGLRNIFKHESVHSMTEQKFGAAMGSLRNILNGLNYANMAGFEKVIELCTNVQFIYSVTHATL